MICDKHVDTEMNELCSQMPNKLKWLITLVDFQLLCNLYIYVIIS